MRANPSYWGRTAAGILFTCENKILLTLRSQEVQTPGVWSIPGGSVSGEAFFDTHNKLGLQLRIEDLWRGAKREVIEELGSMPNDYTIIDTLLFRDGTFSYTTFIVNVDPLVRDTWKIRLNWENDKAVWFPLSTLPANLHHGLRAVL